VVELDGRRQAADDRTEDEAQADGDADHGHALRPLFLIGDIRSRSAGDGDVACHHARDEPRHDHDPELGGEDPEKIGEGVAGQGDDQDATASQLIGQCAPDRREDELQQGIQSAQQAAKEDRLFEDRVATHPFGSGIQGANQRASGAFSPNIVVEQMGEQRDDDTEADDIHEYREED